GGGLSDLPDAIRHVATRRSSLRLDPRTGRLFYLVATAAPGNNTYQQIDAANGALLSSWSGVDQVNPGEGVGVKGDTKKLNGHSFNTVPGNLTAQVSGTWKLQSSVANPDFITYDAMSRNSVDSNPVLTDGGTGNGNDNIWQSANQAAGVDAQYYAALTVQFYNQELGYDWLNDCAVDTDPVNQPHGTYGWPYKVRSVVHFDYSPGGFPYDNAFWDQEKFYMVYGDGGTNDRALSAGQDVVAHELSHAVTQCTNNLVYKQEPGALNESFSDIMATAAEFALEEPNSSNCRRRAGQTTCADWLLGEDLAKTASGAVIRDLSRPEAEGQPSHYQDRSFPNTPIANCGSSGTDYCGVHDNSGIPNHAFYLMVNGGRNARCSGPTDPRADCDVVVPSTSVEHATNIFFAGFSMLTTDSDMCDARNKAIAAASVLYPNATDLAATILAWQAVGLGDQQCDTAASDDFDLRMSDPTLELSAGYTGSMQLTIVRHGDAGTINYTVQTPGPADVTATPPLNSDSSGSQIGVTAHNDAADGVYPVLVTAAGTLNTYYAAASLVIDADPPTAAVTRVAFLANATISTAGALPLSVTWNATDSASGIASKELDHSPNGSGWVSIGTTSPTTYNTTAGPHQFQVVATDAVGNSATSSALIRTLTEFHETALAYAKTWQTNTAGTPWGNTRYSTQPRATATLVFTGTDVVWISQRGPRRGVANVFIDGVKTHVDLYNATALYERRVVFIATGLSTGQHTIKIKVKGTSGRPRVDVDGILVLDP
ncbi:MAG TPA: M4 family metallopeptidase, partial [Candidatus Limnocylindria bacterium]|nr:M4 family metallopeptidase [Candidatus Limnocylindria bacterium]